MSSQGSPYARFSRALERGNLTIIRAAARELPTVPLPDALRVCLLIRDQEPASFERAALRWLARFCLERDVELEHVERAAAAFGVMREDAQAAMGLLEPLCR